MTQINWNLLQPTDVGNAFQQGVETGRARKREGEMQNALGAYAQDPNEQNLNALIPYAGPDQAFKIVEQRQRMAADQQKQSAAKLADGKKAVGQVALQIANLPQQQQAQAWDRGIDYLVGQGYDGLAQFRGRYSPESLRGVLAESGLAQEYQNATKPSYMAIPEGGTLVNTRDAAAVAQFGAPAPGDGPARIANPADYQALAPGAQYIAPDGSVRRKGGAPSQGGATFP